MSASRTRLSVLPTRVSMVSIARTFGKSPEVSSRRRVPSALMLPDGSTTFCPCRSLIKAFT